VRRKANLGGQGRPAAKTPPVLFLGGGRSSARLRPLDGERRTFAGFIHIGRPPGPPEDRPPPPLNEIAVRYTA
jgi:hypothetical protein